MPAGALAGRRVWVDAQLPPALALAALDRLRAAGPPAPEALYHAAWLLNHGDAAGEAHLAHELAREAAERGYAPARWLAAAAYDRRCMYEGRPQKYGTQFVPDGVRYRLWDVDPATADAERASWDVPPLARGRGLRRRNGGGRRSCKLRPSRIAQSVVPPLAVSSAVSFRLLAAAYTEARPQHTSCPPPSPP